MEDLLVLDHQRPATLPRIPEGVGVVRSPLIADKWKAGLAAHPDHEFSSLIVMGIRCGFRIGFDTDQGLAPRCPRTCDLPVSTPNLLTLTLKVS